MPKKPEVEPKTAEEVLEQLKDLRDKRAARLLEKREPEPQPEQKP